MIHRILIALGAGLFAITPAFAEQQPTAARTSWNADGLTPISENYFIDGLEAHGWIVHSRTRVSLVHDETVPVHLPNVAAKLFKEGDEVGGGMAIYHPRIQGEPTTLHAGVWVKYSDNFVQHRSGITKLFYFWSAGTALILATGPINAFGAEAGDERPAWPNEPQGFQVITDQPWHTLPSHPANPWRWNETPNLTIESDPDAPHSPPLIARARVREGLDGHGSHTTSYFLPDEWHTAREICLAAWFKFPSDWVNHPVGSKSMWPRPHNHNNSPYTAFEGSRMLIGVFFPGEPWGGRPLRANSGPEACQDLSRWRDQWVPLEYYFKMNTTNDRDGNTSRADGIVRAWLTAGGQTHKVIDYEDVKWFNVSKEGQLIGRNGNPVTGFMLFTWNPVYGGIGHPAPRDMLNYVDHTYVSAPPG